MRVILFGVFGLVGGGLLAAGPYLSFDDLSGAKLIDADAMPTPLLLVLLAGVVAAAGLGALLFSRRPFGAGLVGLSIAPAAAVVAFHAPRVFSFVLTPQNRDLLRIGGWLVTVGAAVTALAALIAFAVAASRMAPRHGTVLPVLGTIAAAGLLQWWLVAPTGEGSTPGMRYLVVDMGGSVWPGVVGLCALALTIAAVSVAAGRCGAPAVGTALGGALAVGGELGGRFLVGDDILSTFGGRLREESIVLTGATAVVLLVLAIGLAITTSRRSTEVAEARILRDAQARSAETAAGWEQSTPGESWQGGEQSGATGTWGSPEATGTGRSWSASQGTSSTRWSRG